MSTPEQPEAASAPSTLYKHVQETVGPWHDWHWRVVSDAEILAHPTVVAAIAERAGCDRAILIARADLIHRQSQELLDLEEQAEKAEAALADKSEFTVRAVERIYELTAALAKRDAMIKQISDALDAPIRNHFKVSEMLAIFAAQHTPQIAMHTENPDERR